MKVLSRAINYSYLILLFFTPLIFTSWNSELFELPKMYFIFGFTILICSLHLINFFLKNTALFPKNITSIFIGIFLLSQTISTIISVDSHTSIFGYYSRINGGLISVVCFALLFLIIQLYLSKKFIHQIINISLASGFLVAIYAIAQHFGIDNDKWVQDVQNRVFSSLGQPNWLAAYLAVLLPLSLYKSISEYSKNHIKNIILFLINISFYISILYTKSKSGIIATIISLLFFFGLYFLNKLKNKPFVQTSLDISLKKGNLKPPFLREVLREFGGVGFVFISLTLLINNPLSEKIHRHFALKKYDPTFLASIPPSTELITSSENIRKIVWQGTYELWKKFPVFGTGVETFAYSYYWTRPASHNLTSEWDYLYNKAHNEYLNYLSTTGVVGFTAYILLLTFYIIKIIKSDSESLYKTALISSLISIFITNFAGFSVAVISLYLFILPATSDPIEIKDKQLFKPNILSQFLIVTIIIIFILLSRKNLNYYLADIAYNQADSADQKSDLNTATSFIDSAVFLNPTEPLYLIKSASINSQMAVQYASSKNQNGVDQSIDRAIKDSQAAITISPANTNLWKERSQVYYYLSTINPEYFKESLNSLITVTKFAPTDAKTFFLLGQFYEIAQDNSNAEKYYIEAIKLKPNYDHAYYYLGKLYFQEKKYDLAKKTFNETLKITPKYTSATEYLKQIK